MKINLVSIFVIFLMAAACHADKKQESKTTTNDSITSIDSIPRPTLTDVATYCSNYGYSENKYMIIPNVPADSAVKLCMEYKYSFSWDVIPKVFARPNPFRNDALEKEIFSAELSQLVRETKATEKLSRESILQSKTPTDKPLLIEGEVFTSLYEGYTTYNRSDTGYFDYKKSKIPAFFENSHYKEKWVDTLVLSFDNDTWKFHDVIYGRKSQYPTLQGRLKDFIQAGKEEQLQLQKQKK
ncbi:MAG: hypothetical protein ACOVOY_11005 [Sediminibacterium sp.]|jgi:hypothetical protein|nr:hypothetical protein [Chitinophagaceae bacterium]MCE2972975.1 hypothetical protein [Sediminibacterium sp.]